MHMANLGDSGINFYSPDLRHTTVAFSDTELVFEISSKNAVTAAPAWVETETLTFYFFTRNAATS